ncbi:hypothetical protein M3610_10380 [Neobacillus sp. MER 74]|uniref:hypothetical protein n=1 Tax=Neobacillus sp. MER 74 TaxID=2939566 RepID=UPI00203B6DB4|nr:hypothetical protein [Neobacillus sp. MER 74]MCM3115694.1 hypothetical protein [Neobacillus sp. MER 74]
MSDKNIKDIIQKNRKLRKEKRRQSKQRTREFQQKLKEFIFEELPEEKNEDENIIKDFITILFYCTFMLSTVGIIKEGIQEPFNSLAFTCAVLSGIILLILNIKNEEANG